MPELVNIANNRLEYDQDDRAMGPDETRAMVERVELARIGGCVRCRRPAVHVRGRRGVYVAYCDFCAIDEEWNAVIALQRRVFNRMRSR